jgi:hypothetical protein
MDYTPPLRTGIEFIVKSGYAPPLRESIEIIINPGTIDLSGFPFIITNSFSNVSIGIIERIDLSGSPFVITNVIPEVSISVVGPTTYVDLSSFPFSITNTLFPDIVIEEQAPAPSGTFTVKSVVLDIATNYGDEEYTGIRSIDFWFEGSKIANIPTTNFTASASNYASVNYIPAFSFDTTLSKIGSAYRTEWVGVNPLPLRLICVFNVVTSFDEIRINNSHDLGYALRGAKDVKIYTSTDAITDNYPNNPIPNSELIFDRAFAIHSDVNEEDEQTLILTGGFTGVTIDVPSFSVSNTFAPITILNDISVPPFSITSELNLDSIFIGYVIEIPPFEVFSSFEDVTIATAKLVELPPFITTSQFGVITIDGPPPDGSIFFDFVKDNYFPPPHNNVLITLSETPLEVVNVPFFTTTSQLSAAILYPYIPEPPDSPDILSTLTLTSTVDVSPFIACVSEIQTSSELTFFAEGYEIITIPNSIITCSAEVSLKRLMTESNFIYSVCVGQTYSDMLYWNTQNSVDSFDQVYVNMLIAPIESNQNYSNGFSIDSDFEYVNRFVNALISDQEYENILSSEIESNQNYSNGFSIDSDFEYVNRFVNALISDQEYENIFADPIESDQEYINGLTISSDFDYYTSLGLFTSDCVYSNHLTETIQSDIAFVNELLELNFIQSDFVYTNYLLGAPAFRKGHIFRVTI